MNDLKLLDEWLSYDPETGKITWKKSPPNRMNAGDEAGRINHYGYRDILFQGKRHLTHRLAWFLHYGDAPEGQIDHINRDRLDNRICNLRLATPSLQSINRGLDKRNTSGLSGVTWHNNHGKWQAQIKVNRKSIHLGLHENLFNAACARKSAEIKYGFAAKLREGK